MVVSLGKFGQGMNVRVEKLSELFQLVSKFSEREYNIGDYYELGSMTLSYLIPKEFKSSIKVTF